MSNLALLQERATTPSVLRIGPWRGNIILIFMANLRHKFKRQTAARWQRSLRRMRSCLTQEHEQHMTENLMGISPRTPHTRHLGPRHRSGHGQTLTSANSAEVGQLRLFAYEEMSA